MSFPGFGISPDNYAPYVSSIGGFHALGSLASMQGLGRLSDNPSNIVPAGTETQLTANLIDNSSSRFLYVPQASLDLIANAMRSKAYQVISYTSSYSQIVFDVVNNVPKNNDNSNIHDAIATDFSNAIAEAGQNVGTFDSKFWPSNITTRTVNRPAGSQPPGTVTIVDPEPVDGGTVTVSNAPVTHTQGSSFWSDGTPYKTGIYSVDTFLGSSFAGGAVTGGLIAGLAGLVIAYKILR